jgi:hypothetical protein
VQQVFSHLLLVLRDRLDVDQLARHFKWMHDCFLTSTGFSLWVYIGESSKLRRTNGAFLQILRKPTD